MLQLLPLLVIEPSGGDARLTSGGVSHGSVAGVGGTPSGDGMGCVGQCKFCECNVHVTTCDVHVIIMRGPAHMPVGILQCSVLLLFLVWSKAPFPPGRSRMS